MFVQNGFGKTLDILHRSMDVAALRQTVISNNIANADTPNFKRTVVNFEASLKKALDSEQPGDFPAALTNEKHIPFYRSTDYRDVQPRRVLDYWTTSDNNGNNVDLEEEGMLALQNQLNYNIMATAITSQFTQINSVLR